MLITIDIHNDIVVWLSIMTLRKGNCESRNAGTRNGSNVVHTGNYTEMMQEVTINSSFPATILRVHSTAIFRRPSSLSLKNILDRCRDVFLLEPVNSFALTEVNIAK